MKSSIASMLVLAVAFLPGCQTKLTKRHRYPLGQVRMVDDDHARTEVLLNLLEVEVSKTQKSVFELSDRGQAAYLKALGAEVDGKTDFIAGARAELTLPPNTSSVIDKSKFKRRVVTGLRHTPFLKHLGETVGYYYPGDRVVWANIEITIPGDQPFRIRGYDKVDTGYETVDLGNLTRSANFSLTGTGELSASLGQSTEGTRGFSTTRGGDTDSRTRSGSRTNGATTGISGGGSVSGTVGETLTEEVQLRKRYVTMATSVLDDGRRLRVTREGVYGIDLTGAVTVDIELEATKISTSQVFQIEARPAKASPKPEIPAKPETPETAAKPEKPAKTGKPAKGATPAEGPQETTEQGAADATKQTKVDSGAAGITLTQKMKKVPEIRELRMCGVATSVVRHIKRRARSITESDDRIEYLRSVAVPVSIDVRLDRQFIFPVHVMLESEEEARVWISGPKIDKQQLLFDTEADAQHIATWINEHLADLGAFKAYSGGFELVGEAGGSLGKVTTAWVGDTSIDSVTTLPKCEPPPGKATESVTPKPEP